MRLREIFPELELCDLDLFLERVQNNTLYSLFLEIAKWYDTRLPLWRVMTFYGDADLSEWDDEVQVHCALAEHGSGDKHKSARYFKYDRQTGALRPAVYCYKCNKVLTSFWYVYRKERDFRDASLKDILALIWKNWGVEFPRELVLDFDPEAFFTFEDDAEEKLAKGALFARAASYRALKEIDPILWKSAVLEFYNTVMVEAPGKPGSPSGEFSAGGSAQ